MPPASPPKAGLTDQGGRDLSRRRIARARSTGGLGSTLSVCPALESTSRRVYNCRDVEKSSLDVPGRGITGSPQTGGRGPTRPRRLRDAIAARRQIMAVITISRQYGSGGDEVAACFCDRLGYRSFDERILTIPERPDADACQHRRGVHRRRKARTLVEMLFSHYPESLGDAADAAPWGGARRRRAHVRGRSWPRASSAPPTVRAMS